MNSPKRIVLIVPDLGEGGLFQFYNQFVPELARHVEVHIVFANPFHSPIPPSVSGAQCHILAPGVAASRLDRKLAGLPALAPHLAHMLAVGERAWSVVQALEPDLVEVCDWPLGFASALFFPSMPTIVQCHGSMGQIAQHDPQESHRLDDALVQLLEPQLLASAHRLQTYSSSNASFWSNITRRPVQMIRPAFKLPNLPDDIGGLSERAAVFGRLQRWKGPHVLCESLRRIGPTAPIVDWYGSVKPWGSEDQLADSYLAEAFPDIWGHGFCFHPAVDRSVVSELQSRALFNLVPSTWDVFNFTAVEAMAAARPTIVSTGAGASELIVDGENGFTFVNEDAESLAVAIDRVMSMPEKRRREIGKAGRETVRVELDPARIVENRLAAYEEAVFSFAQSPPARPHSWLAELIVPSSGHQIGSSDLLEAMPMRTIARHMKARTLRKIGWRTSRR